MLVCQSSVVESDWLDQPLESVMCGNLFSVIGTLTYLFYEYSQLQWFHYYLSEQQQETVVEHPVTQAIRSSTPVGTRVDLSNSL